MTAICDQLSISLLITLSPPAPSVLGVENFVAVLTKTKWYEYQFLPVKNWIRDRPVHAVTFDIAYCL